MRGSERGASTLGSLLILVLGGGATMVIVALFLTGLAQKQILPRLRDQVERTVAAHMPKKAPPAAEEAAVDSTQVAEVDSLAALRSQIETQSVFLEGRRQELVRLRGGIDSLVALHRQTQSAELTRQAKLLGGMRAEEAARILEVMDDGSVAALLQQMNARAAGKVMARLDARRVARLSMVAIGEGEIETALARTWAGTGMTSDAGRDEGE